VHIALSLLMVTIVALQGSPRGFRWWLDSEIRCELELSSRQVAAIEAEYDRTLAHRRLLRRAFDAANAELTRALARGDLSDTEADALVSRVEDLRRQRNVARMQLLVRMHFLLTPGQRAQLRGVADRASTGISRPC
jgi:Spy/CpxP family protein refolding chaperone